jgi:hypothetical protein
MISRVGGPEGEACFRQKYISNMSRLLSDKVHIDEYDSFKPPKFDVRKFVRDPSTLPQEVTESDCSPPLFVHGLV